jgi:hypothetical protein
MIGVNLFFMIACWYLAKIDFDLGNKISGWISLAISAVNGAIVMNHFF